MRFAAEVFSLYLFTRGVQQTTDLHAGTRVRYVFTADPVHKVNSFG